MLPKNTRIGLLAPVTWSIPPKQYGPWEKVVGLLAKGLVQAGYTEVTVYATEAVHIAGVHLHPFINEPLGENPRSGSAAWEFLHVSCSLEHANTHQDIIHNHLNYHPLLFNSFIKPPIVTTLHGSGIEEAGKVAYSEYKNLPYVSISNAERQFVPDLNYRATVYNGLDFTHQPFVASPEPYLVHVGRMHPQKGVHSAIQLALKLSMPLYLAGLIQPEWQDYFDQQIAPFIDDKKIIFLGNLPEAKVQDLVSKATAYSGLIEWEEPFGLSIAEALSCGTPAIATPLGSHRELIQEGKTGILVRSVEEAVERFSEIKEIDRSVCRKTAQEMFSLETMTTGYLKVYQDALGIV